MRFIFVIISLVIVTAAHATENFERQQIEDRIKPIGQVHVEERSSAVPFTKPAQSIDQPSSTAKTSGQTIYEQYCHVCHQGGIARAPKFRVSSDWNARLTEKNLAGLITSAIKGLNAMPPKGTCIECSDEQIKNAIQYMLPQKNE